MILIYSTHITNRLLYVLDYIFIEQFGTTYRVTDNQQAFMESSIDAKVIYAEKFFDKSSFFIQSNKILFENNVHAMDVEAGAMIKQFVLFTSQTKDSIGFDVFAAIFFLLTRYEEYYDTAKDKFGNYDYTNSILHKHTVLHVPVVEQWMIMLQKKLIEAYPSLQFKKHTPSYLLSFDIDVAYAYRNRSFKRVAGGFVKKIVQLQLTTFAEQLLTVLHLKRDMYDTFDYIQSAIKNKKAVFFFNMGSYSVFDKNPSYQNKKFQSAIKKIAAKNVVGLHPSYQSNTNTALVNKEKNWLENIVGEEIKPSRQHYLKLTFPHTYQTLLANGLQNDFTIGYHDAYGFRAGTCKPFLFFNLQKNEATKLRLYPFAIMEGTLNDVLKLSVSEAKKIFLDLISVVCEFDGVFIPLWHNSTLSNAEHWKGWRSVFEYMLDVIDDKNLENYLVAKWKNIYT